MSTESMTPRERWLAVMRRQPTDRIPTDYWGTPETGQKLMRHFGVSTLNQALDRMGVDYLAHLAPRYAGPPLPPGADEFGVTYRSVDYGSGAYPEACGHPLARYSSADEIEAHYRWPSPDWWDYSGIPAQLEAASGHAVRGGGSEPFLTYAYLRGSEQAYTDLIENPEMVEYCLGKLFYLAYANTTRIFEAARGRVDFSYVAEDMGSQTGLLFAPVHIRRFLFPGMRRMIDLIHAAGAYVFHHNDGNIWRILPELADLGIDVLNPIQWRAAAPGGAGMDRAALKQRFGARLVFHGGVDNQHTLPFGSVEDVRREVRENIALLGAGGGYILAPCHNIQPLTPVENIAAMYGEAKK